MRRTRSSTRIRGEAPNNDLGDSNINDVGNASSPTGEESHATSPTGEVNLTAIRYNIHRVVIRKVNLSAILNLVSTLHQTKSGMTNMANALERLGLLLTYTQNCGDLSTNTSILRFSSNRETHNIEVV